MFYYFSKLCASYDSAVDKAKIANGTMRQDLRSRKSRKIKVAPDTNEG